MHGFLAALSSLFVRSSTTTEALRRAVTRALSPALFFMLALPNFAIGQTNNEGLPVIPLQIVNNYNTATPLYVYIHGIVQDATPDIPAGSTVYVTDLNGDIAIMPVIPSGYQSLSLNLGTARVTTMMFPKLNAVRVYVSSGAGLQVCCNSAVGTPPSEPIGWTSTEPNYNTPFDWAELVWDNSGNAGIGHTTRLGGNVTQVDMFGLPLLLTLLGKSTIVDVPSTSVAGFTANTQKIINAYKQLGAPWTSLLVPNSTTPLRVISPYHGILNGVFPNNELDSYISQVFSFYASNSLTTVGNCPQDGGVTHTFSGSASGGFLIFSENGTARFQFPQPSTLTVYLNEIAASPAPSSPLYACLAGVVAAKLGGAFIRTNLLLNTNLDACNTSQFYVGAPIQQYAQLFHTYGVNHLAYSFGYDDTCNQSSYVTIDNPTGMIITVGGRSSTDTHDFNFDGYSDILWRDNTNDVSAWLMNGVNPISMGTVGNVGATVTVVGQRDFNGDGKADLLLRDTSGNTSIWFLNGTTVSSAASIGNVPTTLSLVGVGDFNGDSMGDLLWEDASGNLSVWLMNNSTVMASAVIGNIPPATLSVAGIGDFNGDGMSDILLRDTSGNTSIWFMNGTTVSSAASVGNIPTTLSVVGIGDFNGDGMRDIVWRDGSGNTSIWLMNGASVLQAGSLGNVPTTLSIALTGDFDANGMSDLLWRDTSGNTSIWFMNGVTVSSTGSVGNISTIFTVQSLNAE